MYPDAETIKMIVDSSAASQRLRDLQKQLTGLSSAVIKVSTNIAGTDGKASGVQTMVRVGRGMTRLACIACQTVSMF